MEPILIAIVTGLINTAFKPPEVKPEVIKKYRLEAPTGLKVRAVSAPKAVTE